MRCVVFGAGAIGGATAVLLAEAGVDVVLVARGAHADAIAARGLTLETPTDTRTVRLPVFRTAAELDVSGDDVVLLAVKSHDTARAVDAVAAVAPLSTPMVCLQNGVANERMCLRVFARVYAVCVMFPAAHLDAGVVQSYSTRVPGILDVGCYPDGSDGRAQRLADAFRSASFAAEVRDDIMRWKYSKLLSNLGNAIEVVCAPSEGTNAVRRALRVEGEACLHAAGIDFASAAEDAERRGDLLEPGTIGGRARGGGSTWQSVARGLGSVETDYLNGEVVLLGREQGVPTPVNARVQVLARAVAAGALAPRTVGSEELLESAADRIG